MFLSFFEMTVDVVIKSLEEWATRAPRGQHIGGHCLAAQAPLVVADSMERVAYVLLLKQCLRKRLEVHAAQLSFLI